MTKFKCYYVVTFLQLLQTAYAIFGSNLQTRSGSQPEISQLLLILSDGRGVFADGVQVCRFDELCSVNDLIVSTFSLFRPPSED